ncbi:MAG TPA: sensor histidine kinase [Candidatus Limnocylindrales bacterium]|nr:sensor histidine kinase [Candidatus Limnocylindrales bacterium]
MTGPLGPRTPRADGFAATPRDGAWRPFYRLVAVLFIAFPIVNVLSFRPDAVEIALVGGGTALFAAVTMINFRSPPQLPAGIAPPTPMDARTAIRRVGPSAVAVSALLVIALALCLYRPDAGWFAFFYYASVAASTIRLGRLAVAMMVAAGLGAAGAFVVINGDPGAAFIQGLSVTVIGTTVYSAVAVRRTNRQLVAARHELARLAVADERARIARDLHDTLGHSLSVITLKSELAGRVLDAQPRRAKAEIADVERVAREALASVRETIRGVRQPSLANELAGARSTFAAAGIEARVEPAPEGLPDAVDAALAWAVREGVTNVVRHGDARSAEIVVEHNAGQAAVEIRNDRRPTVPDAPALPDPHASGTAASGTGLAGLRERIALIGGRLESGPTPDGGFRLRVTAPLGIGAVLPESTR